MEVCRKQTAKGVDAPPNSSYYYPVENIAREPYGFIEDERQLAVRR